MSALNEGVLIAQSGRTAVRWIFIAFMWGWFVGIASMGFILTRDAPHATFCSRSILTVLEAPRLLAQIDTQ